MIFFRMIIQISVSLKFHFLNIYFLLIMQRKKMLNLLNIPIFPDLDPRFLKLQIQDPDPQQNVPDPQN